MVRSSRVDLGLGSSVRTVRHDPAVDRTIVLSTGGSLGQLVASINASGTLTGVFVSLELIYAEPTVDPASGWVWIQPVADSSRLLAVDAGGNLVAQFDDPAVTSLLDLTERDGGGLVAVGSVPAEPGLVFIDVDAAGAYEGYRLFEHRPTQGVPRFGRALDIVSRGGRLVAKASFRLAISSMPPVGFVMQGALEGEVGQAYCPQPANSTGEAARLTGAGSSGAADNLVVLVGDRLPAGSFGLFVTSQTQGLVPGAGGSLGSLFLGGAIGRFVGAGQVAAASPEGRLVLPVDLSALPQGSTSVPVLAGQAWNFQTWYRDTTGGAATSRVTNGSRIVFQ